nr:serine-rich adhesin for platelets-like [Cherax quadricarinatus]XP_053653998.1 serine-rich adhesin for platelets-like [Cherax quadricarinatus]XP_053653999.1 serine-rich adhesin for platelets-like [Cherax quadricarinatus]
MRRMKIRATPNFGVGGGGPRTTSARSVPASAALPAAAAAAAAATTAATATSTTVSTAGPSPAVASNIMTSSDANLSATSSSAVSTAATSFTTVTSCTAAPTTAASSSSAPFSSMPSSVALLNKQTQEDTTSSIIEDKVSVSYAAVSDKLHSENIISHDAVKIVEESHTSENMESHQHTGNTLECSGSVSLSGSSQRHRDLQTYTSQCDAAPSVRANLSDDTYSSKDVNSSDQPSTASNVLSQNKASSMRQISNMPPLSKLSMPKSSLSGMFGACDSLSAVSPEAECQSSDVIPIMMSSVRASDISVSDPYLESGFLGPLQQISESKPMTSIRRKKIKVMPMVSSSRKGNLTEKRNIRPVNTDTSKVKFDAEVDYLSDKLSDNKEPVMQDQPDSHVEVNIVSPTDKHTITSEQVYKHETKPAAVSLAMTHVALKDSNTSFPVHTCNTPPVEESQNTDVLTDSEKLIEIDGETTSDVLENKLSRVNESNQCSAISNVEIISVATASTCKRRSKIRATPTFLPKNKTTSVSTNSNVRKESETLIVIDDGEASVDVMGDKVSGGNEDTQSSGVSKVDTSGSASSTATKRRSKIRATPTFLTKNKIPSLNVNRNIATGINTDRNIPADVIVDSSITVGINVNSSIPTDVNVDIPTSTDTDRSIPAVVNVERNIPTVINVERNTPTVMNIERDIPTLANVERDIPTENENLIVLDEGETCVLEDNDNTQSSVVADKQLSSVVTGTTCTRRHKIRTVPVFLPKSRVPSVCLDQNIKKQSEKLIVLDDDEATVTTLEDDVSGLNENSQSSVVSISESNGSATNISCKRRSKIRATPMFAAKRKMVKKLDTIEEDKIQEDNWHIEVMVEKVTSQESSLNENVKIIDHDHDSFRKDCEDESVAGLKPIPYIEEPSKLDLRDSNKLQPNTKFEIEDKDCSILEGRSQKTTSEILSMKRENSPNRIEIVEDNNSNDDSNGDKENSSVFFSSSQTIKKESILNKRNKSQTLLKTKAKSSVNVSNKKTSVKVEKLVKNKIASDHGLSPDDSEEKKIFRERKEKYRKKVSKGDIERSSMTMFDLIFWNPATNPMPGRSESSKKKPRRISTCETESIASDVVEEQRIDDLGLDEGDTGQPSPSTTEEVQACKESNDDPVTAKVEEEPKKEDEDEEEEEEKNKKKKGKEKEKENEEEENIEDIFAPRVKIGPNGQIILDEHSIKIQTTAAKNRYEILSKAEVVEENNESVHYSKWSKRRSRSSEWTLKETARFYKALSTVGTDFSLMESLFTWRSRAELKTKFKKEEKINRDLVDRALKDKTQFDFSLFDDESDYDPEEDRKATRIAERAEAKRRRLEMKQCEREREKELKKMKKKEEKAEVQRRKAILRKECKKRRRKRRGVKQDEDFSETDNINLEVVQKTCVGTRRKIKRKAKIRRPVKRRQMERRNSLVISEVTVTMETVKYETPRNLNAEYMVERTVEEHSEAERDPLEAASPPPGLPMTEELPKFDNTQNMWHFPVSAIQTQEDGCQTILVPTADGHKIVPVPVLPPGTSNVLVVATEAPDLPGEQIYHVYVVSPVEGNQS